MFEKLLTKFNVLNHYYLNSFVEFMNNVIYFFLQIIIFQNMKLYLQYIILRKNHRLRTMILLKSF